MGVEEFLSTLDALRFDTDIDEQYPELRGMVRQCYPIIRKLYNMMYDAGLLQESVNESHGNKKHNAPKDALAAIRKGNREGEMEVNGPGFKSTTKTHKSAKKDEKQQKINKYNYNKFIDECVRKSLNEFVMSQTNADDDDFGKYAPGLEVNWGDDVENCIKKLSDIFAEYNVPEKDEYGISRTQFDDMIAHLKYYYDVKEFNYKVLMKIQNILENYDLLDDEKVRKILNRLKLYC